MNEENNSQNTNVIGGENNTITQDNSMLNGGVDNNTALNNEPVVNNVNTTQMQDNMQSNNMNSTQTSVNNNVNGSSVSQPNQNKKNTSLYIVIVLIVVILALIGYIVFGKDKKEDNRTNNSNDTTKQEDNSSNDTKNPIIDTSKEYSKDGFSIKLDGYFKETELEGVNVFYQGATTGLTALKEDFKTLNLVGYGENSTLEEYGKLVLKANKFEGQELIPINDNLIYFEYNRTIDDIDYYYLGVVTKGSDAFWLVNFFCADLTKGINKDKFITWAKTIKVE